MNTELLSYDDALSRILAVAEKIKPPYAITVSPGFAGNHAAAEDLFASDNLPAFANSAVDGYAVRLADTLAATPQNPVLLSLIQGDITAGSSPTEMLGQGQAARIFTGAPIPPGTNAIVMQEDTRTDVSGFVEIVAPAGAKFVRTVGSDVTAGQVILRRGERIDDGATGLFAALGFMEVPVFHETKVAVLTTGNEIVPIETNPLPPGKIRDANGPMLLAAIGRVAYADENPKGPIPDDYEATKAALLHAASWANVVVTSGGVSVGDHDHVTNAVREIGTLEFWRIAIKPGKPLAFGRIHRANGNGSALFFGLPGNPVSALVTFELFVRPALLRMGGHTNVTRPQISVTLTADLPHEPGRREFVRAKLEYKNNACLATPTGAQGSHRLMSLVGADALLIADENCGDYCGGEVLPAMLLHA